MDEGIGVNHGALLETLIQLSDFRQYEMAKIVMEACEKDQLERLMHVPDHAFTPRMRYVIEAELHKKVRFGFDKARAIYAVMVYVFNAWCQEGRRSAIRAVLFQMREIELSLFMKRGDLDREVCSMIREFVAG